MIILDKEELVFDKERELSFLKKRRFFSEEKGGGGGGDGILQTTIYKLGESSR